jgi:hypothetical protein
MRAEICDGDKENNYFINCESHAIALSFFFFDFFPIKVEFSQNLWKSKEYVRG